MRIETKFSKTRLAPTPSGYLHLGNIFSFSVTAALARRAGATILLRIDDLDRDRMKREYVEDIFESLRFLGIPWDEGPRDITELERSWSQIHRLHLYREALQQLREEGKIFACDCSRLKVRRETSDGAYSGTCREKGLALDLAGCSWRVRTEGVGRVGSTGVSAAARGAVRSELTGVSAAAPGAGLPAEMIDFIVRKKDGFPAYQLTSLVDDLHFGIGLVVRGEDLRASTAAQQWLAAELGREEFRHIRFIHHPLLTDEGTEKMSKSAGSQSVQFLRRHGVKPADIYSRIARRLGVVDPVANWQELAEAAGY
ncbi:MAG TPA: glutamate--tRNA ligase family protein [Puia sp.]|nr:glutamate--tRNA ligase family protein [Puia sp.]